MKEINWKKMLTHIGAVLIFLILTLVYFSPVLQGKDIVQDDAIGSMGWGKDALDYHEETGEYSYWSNSMFSGMPCNYTYAPQPANTFEPIGNTITLNTFGASRRHIGCIFATFLGCYIMFLAFRCRPLLSIAGSIAYTLCSYNFIIIAAGHMNKSLVIATIAPIIGGIYLCYKRKLLTGALVTLIFAGLNIYWSHQQMSYYTAIIAAIMAIVYFIYAYREKWLPYYWKATGVIAVAAVLSIAPAVGILLPTNDYAKESMRGGSALAKEGDGKTEGLDMEYAFEWSYGIGETLNLFVPNAFGAASGYDIGTESNTYSAYLEFHKKQYINAYMQGYGISQHEAARLIEEPQIRSEIERSGKKEAENFVKHAPAYWGAQSQGTSGPVYMGAIVCFLFILGLFIVKGPEKWWLAAATVFSLILAWGSNMESINSFLFEYMPLYNKFRAPSQALVITTLTMSLLAILAVKRFVESCSANENRRLMRDEDKSLRKAIFYSMGIAGGTALFLALFGSSIFSFKSETDANTGIASIPELYDALIADRKAMLTADAWRSFLFVALSGGVLLAFIYIKRINKALLVAALSLILVADMWPVCKRFLNDDMFMPKKKTTAIKETEADKYIHSLEGDGKYRLLDLTRGSIFNQAYTSYYHNSIGGYSPVKLSRYQDIISVHLSAEINDYIESLNKAKNLSYAELLNDKSVMNMLNTEYLILGNTKESVIENPYAFGHCWLVDRIEWMDGPRNEIAALAGVSKQTAFIDKEWKDKIDNPEQYSNNAPGTIELTEYRNPGNIVYKSSCTEPKLAVFSDIYYKTWKAYIDGKEVAPLRANYILRALPIPAGEHTIEFKCVDELMETSHTWSLYLSILVGIVIVALAAFIIYRKAKGIDNEWS